MHFTVVISFQALAHLRGGGSENPVPQMRKLELPDITQC